jgi:hypothetical protein
MDEIKAGRYQLFKGSSNEISRHSRLWRYMTFEKFCWLIETSQLYHARLDKFDDPFEGAVTHAYARLRDTGAIEPYFSLKEFEPKIIRLLRFHNYAACWHASEHESDAQWRLYASGGAGIALVSTMERMRNSVEFSPHPSGILGQVEYVDFETHDMARRPSGTFIRPGHLKRKSFEHEKEVRGIIIANIEDRELIVDDACLKIAAKMPIGINARVNLGELIEAIVISPVAAKWTEELVMKVTERHGLSGLVRKSSLCGGTPSY